MLLTGLASELDGVQFPVLAVDEDGYYVYSNQAAAEFAGYSNEELTGKHLTDLMVYEAPFTMASFARLKARGHLSGRVTYRCGDNSLKSADVNVLAHTLADGTRVFVSLVHPLAEVIDELPEVLREDSYGLIDTEIRLLQLIADGFSDESMTVLLGQTPEEVAQQLHGVLDKMKAASRTEAAVTALKKRVIL